MKTLLFLLPLSLVAADVPVPKVSDTTRAAYVKALLDTNAAQANAIQLTAAIAKAQADSAKAVSDASDAAQKALIAAQADCGAIAQLDGKALQEKGELSCVVKVTPK